MVTGARHTEMTHTSLAVGIPGGVYSAVERGGGGGGGGGQGGKLPRAPRSLRKNLFDNFSILTANVNPFHVSC